MGAPPYQKLTLQVKVITVKTLVIDPQCAQSWNKKE